MKDREYPPTPEIILPKVDVLIVLGRNFIPGFDRKTLAEQRFHLSPISRINTLAAGMIFEAGLADNLIISTGFTAGRNLPSEAAAMRAHLQRFFSSISDAAIFLEERSIDTESNVTEVVTILKQHPDWQRVGDRSGSDQANPTNWRSNRAHHCRQTSPCS